MSEFEIMRSYFQDSADYLNAASQLGDDNRLGRLRYWVRAQYCHLEAVRKSAYRTMSCLGQAADDRLADADGDDSADWVKEAVKEYHDSLREYEAAEEGAKRWRHVYAAEGILSVVSNEGFAQFMATLERQTAWLRRHGLLVGKKDYADLIPGAAPFRGCRKPHEVTGAYNFFRGPCPETPILLEKDLRRKLLEEHGADLLEDVVVEGRALAESFAISIAENGVAPPVTLETVGNPRFGTEKTVLAVRMSAHSHHTFPTGTVTLRPTPLVVDGEVWVALLCAYPHAVGRLLERYSPQMEAELRATDLRAVVRTGVKARVVHPHRCGDELLDRFMAPAVVVEV